jgi:hypothetical protein
MRARLALLLLAAASAPALAAGAPDARAGFIQSCEKQMYMPAPACACLADKADRQLDARAIAYLSLPALDVAHSTAMARSMTGAEMHKIDHFMKTAPHQCEGAK